MTKFLNEVELEKQEESTKWAVISLMAVFAIASTFAPMSTSLALAVALLILVIHQKYLQLRLWLVQNR